jgi:vesicle coat complex subunit
MSTSKKKNLIPNKGKTHKNQVKVKKVIKENHRVFNNIKYPGLYKKDETL